MTRHSPRLYPISLSIRMSQDLLEKADKNAKTLGLNRNQYLRILIERDDEQKKLDGGDKPNLIYLGKNPLQIKAILY